MANVSWMPPPSPPPPHIYKIDSQCSLQGLECYFFLGFEGQLRAGTDNTETLSPLCVIMKSTSLLFDTICQHIVKAMTDRNDGGNGSYITPHNSHNNLQVIFINFQN